MSVDQQELKKFAQLAHQWWDVNGDLKTLHDINPARIEFMDKQIDWPEKRVLDVGCGGGILSEAMARLGAKVTAIDCEASAINAAQLHAEQEKLSIEYLNRPIEEISNTYDVLTCMEMLEHVPKPERIIEHCARVLNPGGYCFLSTINRTVKAYVYAVLGAEYLFKLLPRQTHEYQKFIKPSELAKVLRQHGLEVISLKGIAYNPLSRKASLDDEVSVNYLMAAQKI